MSQHIYLTGYRGTGKTSVAKILAKQLQLGWLDLDDQVETASGKSIREIFQSDGEDVFRDWETKCLTQVADQHDSKSTGQVIALGGGAILRPVNRQMIADSGVCIWLDADADTLSKRIFGDQTSHQRRPSLTDLDPVNEIHQMLKKRESLYRSVSQLRVDTVGKTQEAVAAEVQAWLNKRG